MSLIIKTKCTITLVGRGLLEMFVIQLPPSFQEEQYPAYVKNTSNKKDPEYSQVIGCHNDGINHQGDHGKEDVDQRTGQEVLDTAVIADALHDIPDELDIKKGNRQAHQLDQEIGDQGDADPGGDMEHDPAADHIVGHGPCRENDLPTSTIRIKFRSLLSTVLAF
jgi:hypothetical protein